MPTRRTGDPSRIRWLSDGLIDGLGVRWDQVAGGTYEHLSPTEAQPFIESAWRFVNTTGINNRAKVIEQPEFVRLVGESPEHPVQAFRAADGTGRIIVSFDSSDC